jgi:hypothetical protein
MFLFVFFTFLTSTGEWHDPQHQPAEVNIRVPLVIHIAWETGPLLGNAIHNPSFSKYFRTLLFHFNIVKQVKYSERN